MPLPTLPTTPYPCPLTHAPTHVHLPIPLYPYSPTNATLSSFAYPCPLTHVPIHAHLPPTYIPLLYSHAILSSFYYPCPYPPLAPTTDAYVLLHI